MRVLGVDPGGAHTGLAVRDRDDLIAFKLLSRRKGEPLDAWVGFVAERCARMLVQTDARLLAVEDVNPPVPHMGVISMQGLLDTAAVLGAVIGLAAQTLGVRCVVVPPAGHGSAPLACYPPPLVGVRERKGGGELRHCRAAWDVAHAGRVQVRLEDAQAEQQEIA